MVINTNQNILQLHPTFSSVYNGVKSSDISNGTWNNAYTGLWSDPKKSTALS